MNNPNNQSPNQPGNQMSDQFQQLLNEVRTARNENQQLRGQLDMMARQFATGQPQQQPTKAAAFDPKVQQALDEEFNKRLGPIQNQFQQVTGMMRDETDEAKFRLTFRGSKYDKYIPEVEAEMRNLKSQGKWMPREQVLQYQYFQDQGKKAQEPAAAAQQIVPVYDSYINQWKDPVSGQVVAQPSAIQIPPGGAPQVAQDQQQQQQQVQQQQQQQPNPAQMPNGYQQPGQQPFFAQPQQQQDPNQQNNWTPNLGNSAPPPPGGQGTAPVNFNGGLTVDASDKTLDGWAEKYGDVPL